MAYLMDEHCSLQGGQVVDDYSCMLNQTDISSNANKFYTLQVLSSGKEYYVFTRYGRIGLKGTSNLIHSYSKDQAINSFTKQFKTKTGLDWSQRKSSQPKPGKYYVASVNTLSQDQVKTIQASTITKTNSTLPEKVQSLLSMLGDMQMMNRALIQLDIDTSKMPLGKIDAVQLERAKQVLDQIKALLVPVSKTTLVSVTPLVSVATKPPLKLRILGKERVVTGNNIVDLSSSYYTYIPIVSGRHRPPIIDNETILKKYYDILDDLANISVGVKILNAANSSIDHPLDAMYRDINTSIKPLEPTSNMWQQLQLYVANTQAKTHDCHLEITDIFEIEQLDKRIKYDQFCQSMSGPPNCVVRGQALTNKTLLFHGTPQSCVLSIFQRDFFLDPSQLGVIIAGKMFGYGIYFADMASKSFNYTRASSTGNVGCLLVAEVALGQSLQLKDADSSMNADKLSKQGCHSTKGCGATYPSVNVEGEVTIPNGSVNTSNDKTSLLYNEYIVYHTAQQLLKYLIIVKNTK